MAGSVAAGLFLVSRRLGVVTLVAALLMAFARVYVGAHWPGDVVAGLLVGALVAVVGFKLVERPAVAVVAFLVRTPLRPLLVSGAAARDESGSPTTGPGSEPTAAGR
jgi:undecaprenyl-diphosphatase